MGTYRIAARWVCVVGLACSPSLAMAQVATAEAPPPEIYPDTIPVAQPAPPAPERSSWGLVLGLDLEFGGDDVARIYFEDGSSQGVNAGQGVSLDVGVHYRTVSNWDFRGTFGYKYVTTKADNADLYLDRFVIEAAVDYIFDAGWFLGGGFVHHNKIEFHGDDIGPNFKLEDASGFMIEAGWSYIGLRYTFMDYEDEFGYQYDANNIGVFLIGRF